MLNSNNFSDNNEQIKTIYLAGGCFWGIDAYFSQLNGVINTATGYANGSIENPTYNEVTTGTTDFAETVKIEYAPSTISLEDILFHFFDIIDPTTLNRQGNDMGTQYRSGIFYSDDEDIAIIQAVLTEEGKKHHRPIVVEVEKLKNFYKAEDYHQDYLEKNPHGYCHINLSNVKKYQKPSETELKEKLSDLEYDVTQRNSTEKPFSSEYNQNDDEGIYVDVVTGEPLFSSNDKYNSGSGWPSFTKTIDNNAVNEKLDSSNAMERIEVRSKFGNSHLGHVFDDGPIDLGGKRYCINGASMRFIPKDNLVKQGYSEYLEIFE